MEVFHLQDRISCVTLQKDESSSQEQRRAVLQALSFTVTDAKNKTVITNYQYAAKCLD